MNKLAWVFSASVMTGIISPAMANSSWPVQALVQSEASDIKTSQRIVVRFAKAVSDPLVENLLNKLQISTGFVSKKLDGLMIIETPVIGSDKLFALLRNSTLVRYVEWDQRVSLRNYNPTEPLYSEQYWLKNFGQPVQGVIGEVGEDIGFEQVNHKSSSHSILVALLDTGVDYRHNELEQQVWFNADEALDGTDTDGDGFVDNLYGADLVDADGDPMDLNGHGTHCAGIIAASQNGQGIQGVASEYVKILPVRVLDQNGNGNLSDIVMGLEFALQQGASISNNSYGFLTQSQALLELIEEGNRQGHLFVSAAGNKSSNMDGLLGIKDYPGALNNENILNVAALDNQGQLASYSNYGARSVDIAAYGSHVLSSYLNNSYAYLSGTSMAAPVVTGIAAFLKSMHPELSHLQMKQAILAGSHENPDLTGKVLSAGSAHLKGALRWYEEERPGTPPLDEVSDEPDKEGSSAQSTAVFEKIHQLLGSLLGL
ncbi:MAG: S8 family serine peptidase [Thiotrichales bacterium]|nr:S8 family serine peptidase [Thiotrichales bacterium]